MDAQKNGGLTEKDFYDKAWEYFLYHAEQRTTMINYFIALFGAGVALYGSLLEAAPIACILISVFLFVVSRVFYAIDVRNRFDVKQSQSVICQFERDYGMDLPKDRTAQGVETNNGKAQCAYGVFSNEDHIFALYDKDFRKKDPLYRKHLEKDTLRDIDAYVEANPYVSSASVMDSMGKPAIPHLSHSIKRLYDICMIASLVGFAAATLVCFFPILER